MKYDIRYTSIENPTLAHFRHFSSLFTNFSSTTVESALQIALFMQNKPNFRKSQMNVNNVLTKNYEKRTLGERGKNKPNSNPIQTQSNPIKANKMPKQTQFKPKQTQFQTEHLLINRMNQICCLYPLNIPFGSAKMALYTDNLECEKTAVKKLNFLKCKRLNKLSWRSILTGTLFAYSNSWNFFYTDDRQ